MILYIYDLKFKTKKEFDRLKRKFYYSLGNITASLTAAGKNYQLTKSTIIVPDNKEAVLDSFFKTFKQKEGNIIAFKVFTTDIEEL